MQNITFEKAKAIMLGYIALCDNKGDTSYTEAKNQYQSIYMRTNAKERAKFKTWYEGIAKQF